MLDTQQMEFINQIKKWQQRREKLDDLIDSIYEKIDKGYGEEHSLLMQQKEMLKKRRDELDDQIDGAFEQMDNLLKENGDAVCI